MIRFSTYVSVYDKEGRQIPIFPSMLSDRQLKELKDFCKKFDYVVIEEKSIDMCFLPYEN